MWNKFTQRPFPVSNPPDSPLFSGGQTLTRYTEKQGKILSVFRQLSENFRLSKFADLHLGTQKCYEQKDERMVQ